MSREIVSRYPEATFEWEGAAVADVSDPGHEMASVLQDTVEGSGRIRPELTPAIALSDCRYWRYRGIPAFWYGPDGSLCSAANESVDIEELLHVVRTFPNAAAIYLSSNPAVEPTSSMAEQLLLNGEPDIKVLPSIRVARITATAKDFSEAEVVVGPMMTRLYDTLSERKVTFGAVSIAIYEMRKGAVTVSAAIPFAQEVQSCDGFEVVELSPVEAAASVVHRGALETTGKTWNALRPWIRKQGFLPKEVYREVYIIDAPNPQELWATELQQAVGNRK